MQQQQLRQQLLAKRAAISAPDRAAEAAAVCEHLLALPELQKTKRIGSYISVKAELPTPQLNQRLVSMGHQLSVPVLHPINTGHLLFLQVHPKTLWVPNKYHIPEPALQVADITPLAHLDILLVPLVGFDHQGNRLGMGGGFYDRTLAAWHHGAYPHLQVIGLALTCQQTPKLPVNPWDIPLNKVITAAKVWDFLR